MKYKLGSLEELILLAVGSLGEDSYAVTIQTRIEEAANAAPTMGAVYTSLERLEKKGFLRSHLGDITHEQGGRRKRFYQITGFGSAAVSHAREVRERLWSDFKLQPDSKS